MTPIKNNTLEGYELPTLKLQLATAIGTIAKRNRHIKVLKAEIDSLKGIGQQTLKTYLIASEKKPQDNTPGSFVKKFNSSSDARHWVINTLDLSLDWSVSEVK
jgi:hypothetical protein